MRMLLSLLALLLSAGCANFQAVHASAGQLVAAADSWRAVTDDFAGSCARRNLVNFTAGGCAEEKAASAQLGTVNQVLGAYFMALQQASTTSNFSLDGDIANLSASIGAIPGANAEQVAAVSGLASFLADLATRRIEERTVDALLARAGQAEQVVDLMGEVVAPQVTRLYGREQSQTKAAFAHYIQQSGAPADALNTVDCSGTQSIQGFGTGTAFLLGQAYCARISVLTARRSALDDYKDSLATARQTLQRLASGQERMSAKDLARQLISDASRLRRDVDKINKAF